MFQRLVRDWTLEKGMAPREVATKVKVFPHISLLGSLANYARDSASSITMQ